MYENVRGIEVLGISQIFGCGMSNEGHTLCHNLRMSQLCLSQVEKYRFRGVWIDTFEIKG